MALHRRVPDHTNHMVGVRGLPKAKILKGNKGEEISRENRRFGCRVEEVLLRNGIFQVERNLKYIPY